MRKSILTIVGSLALAASLAACGGHTHPQAHAAASSAAAKVSALATSSPIAADRAKAKADVIQCATQIGVVKLTLHPKVNFPAFKACMDKLATNKQAFDTCVNGLVAHLGFGPGKLTAYTDGLAACLVAGPTPSSTP